MKKKKYFETNLKIILNSSCLIVFFFITISFLLTLFHIYRQDTDKKHIYFHLQQESSPFSVPLEKYMELYSQLCNHTEFDYYEIYRQYLEGLPDSQDFFNYETEDLSKNCQAALCIQISENLQNDNDLKCITGRTLNSNDYFYRGDTIPIVLGYEYRDLFSPGSQFSATYLYHTYTFKVIGILEKDSRICDLPETVYLDKYIVMPSFNVSEFTGDKNGILIHYANKTSGLLIFQKKDFKYVSDYIKQLLSNAACGDYSIDVSPAKYSILEKTGIPVEWFMAVLSIAAFIFGISYIKYIHKKKKYIIQNTLLFTCAEFVCGILILVILYKLFPFLFLLKRNMKIFIILEIFAAILHKNIDIKQSHS